MMGNFWDRLKWSKKEKEAEKPPLAEGEGKVRRGIKPNNDVISKRPVSPPPPLPPPKRILSEDVSLKKKSKKKKIKKERKDMPLPEITYEYHQCSCDEWKKHLPQIVKQQDFAVNRGRKEGINLAYDMKPFNFCPWCGWKRYRSNRGKKPSK